MKISLTFEIDTSTRADVETLEKLYAFIRQVNGETTPLAVVGNSAVATIPVQPVAPQPLPVVVPSPPAQVAPSADGPFVAPTPPPPLPPIAPPSPAGNISAVPPVPPSPFVGAPTVGEPNIAATPSSGAPAPLAVPTAPVAMNPATASAPVGAPELDAVGVPWTDAIHSSSKAKNKDGTWRRKKNLDDASYNAIMQQLRAGVTAPLASAGPPAPHVPAATLPPPAPIAPAAPAAVPVPTPAPVAPPPPAIPTPPVASSVENISFMQMMRLGGWMDKKYGAAYAQQIRESIGVNQLALLNIPAQQAKRTELAKLYMQYSNGELTMAEAGPA